MNARAIPFYTRRFISGINTKFSRVLHTQKFKYATYKHMKCRHNTAYILHTYCIYICYLAAHIRHIYSIYTAYVHTCTCYTCMLHACCTHNTSILHACMRVHKNWFSATCISYKHMKKCMQFVCNCLHASCMLHIIIVHILHTFIQVCATSCACMWHACGAEPIFVYAAHIQYGCIVCAAYMQYVQQGSR